MYYLYVCMCIWWVPLSMYMYIHRYIQCMWVVILIGVWWIDEQHMSHTIWRLLSSYDAVIVFSKAFIWKKNPSVVLFGIIGVMKTYLPPSSQKRTITLVMTKCLSCHDVIMRGNWPIVVNRASILRCYMTVDMFFFISENNTWQDIWINNPCTHACVSAGAWVYVCKRTLFDTETHTAPFHLYTILTCPGCWLQRQPRHHREALVTVSHDTSSLYTWLWVASLGNLGLTSTHTSANSLVWRIFP